MLHGQYGSAALDALLRMDWERQVDQLIEAALDKRLHGNTRAHAIERIRWIEDREIIVRRLVPLLDDGSKAKEESRICDVVAELIIFVATGSTDSEAENPALRKLKAKIAHVEGETYLETRARKIEAARQWASATGDK